MAANEHEEPNGNRATIALVSSKIDGLHELVRAEIGNLQRQMDGVEGLPLVVNGMLVTLTRLDADVNKLADLPDRVSRLEDSDSSQLTAAQQKRAYRSGTLPMILLGAVGALFTGVGVILTYVALSHPH